MRAAGRLTERGPLPGVQGGQEVPLAWLATSCAVAVMNG